MIILVKKVTKTKGRKTKKYIRNSQNNKIHKKLIEIPIFFSRTLKRMLQRIFTPKIRILGAFFSDLEQNNDSMHKLA